MRDKLVPILTHLRPDQLEALRSARDTGSDGPVSEQIRDAVDLLLKTREATRPAKAKKRRRP